MKTIAIRDESLHKHLLELKKARGVNTIEDVIATQFEWGDDHLAAEKRGGME